MKGIPVADPAEVIRQAESYAGIRAGVVRLEDVLRGPSYMVLRTGVCTMDRSTESVTKWIEEGRSVLVLGLSHPVSNLPLDWFHRGNSLGNRILMDIIGALIQWIRNAYGLNAQLLPYFLEQGGVFLKDAAVLAGLGIIGRNNLLIHREWGPRIRLRAMLIEGDLQPTQPVENFSPCEACDKVCQKVCPGKAFSNETYIWPACLSQLNFNKDNSVPTGALDNGGNPVSVIKWCRECELVCPVAA
jgi:epoxyqueuosine reductase